MKTVCIQIGNSDNKLTQEDWASFVEQTSEAIRLSSWECHFNGSSDTRSKWQNACWVVNIQDEYVFSLKQELRSIAHAFKQDSVAFMIGDVEFLS